MMVMMVMMMMMRKSSELMQKASVMLHFTSLIATLSIAIWKPSFKWLRKNGPELFNAEPRPFKKKLGVFNRRFMKVHNWLGVIAAVVGTAHGFVLEWHWTLWAGMAGIWVLIFSGSLLQWKWPPKRVSEKVQGFFTCKGLCQ